MKEIVVAFAITSLGPFRLLSNIAAGTIVVLMQGYTMIDSFWLKRGLLLLAAYVLYLFSWHSAFGADGSSISPTYLPQLHGKPISKEALNAELSQHIHIDPSGSNTIGRIIIEDHADSITQATWLYVKNALDHYKKTRPAFIILELNTPGGEVYAAQKIAEALKQMDTQHNIPCVAYINNWAISAGAMLAYSCRFIAAASDASMGAAEPVIEGAEGKLEAASEKINSALRADFANHARYFGRDPLIAEAMVDKDLILVIRDGAVIKLDAESQIKTEGPNPDRVLSPKGKLLTLDAEQMIALGVADLMVTPMRLPPLTSEEESEGKWAANKSALFHQPFFDAIPNATIETFQMDWKMRFFALLASPLVSSLLMLGLMLGFYLEVSTPGFGLPGTVAVTCLFLILLSSFALEIANWLEVILLISGLVVILIELFVLPSFGLLGFIGIIAFLIGLFGMMLPGADGVGFEPATNTLNPAGEVFLERLAWLSGTFVLGVALILLLARFVTPKLAGISRFVLRGNEQVGYTSVDNLAALPKAGSKGTAATTLRPAGKVIIDDTLYDAISEGSFIEKGDEVVVAGIDSGTLIVHNLSSTQPPEAST
jgi:membrane-bound ClpP family serine protease